MKPPKFDGKTHLDEFIVAFENCAQFNHWSKYDKAAYLRNSLSGSASQLLRGSASDSYSELVGKLERRYGTEGQQERFRAEIRCRRRKKGESVAELAEDIRCLMALAYPGDQAVDVYAAIARDSFLTALDDPELEEHVRYQEPEDLDEACRIALRYEVIHNAVYAEPPRYRDRQARQGVEEAETDSEETDETGDCEEKWNQKSENPRLPTDVRSAKAEATGDSGQAGQNIEGSAGSGALRTKASHRGRKQVTNVTEGSGKEEQRPRCKPASSYFLGTSHQSIGVIPSTATGTVQKK